MALPGMFCWSKFGAEAGEPATQIIERKEHERRQNGGVFLWGIGNSIRPSLTQLVQQCGTPEVLFTPMQSRPSERDVSPSEIYLWQDAIGMDGRPYLLPCFSAVTSRAPSRRAIARHFALVCMSDEPLRMLPAGDCRFSVGAVRNLRTGSEVGSSQVTSVVRFEPNASGQGRTYSVTFRAGLVYPYLATLHNPVLVPPGTNRLMSAGVDLRAAVGRLLDLRREHVASPSASMTLF